MRINFLRRGYKNARVLDKFNKTLNNLKIEVIQ